MDQIRSVPPEYILGRNFLEIVKNLKTRSDRTKAVQVGDCIEMSASIFNQWGGIIKSGESDSLKPEGKIIVVAEHITYNDLQKLNPDKILVSAEGVKKEVDASLFYNYGYRSEPPYSLASDSSPSDATQDQGFRRGSGTG